MVEHFSIGPTGEYQDLVAAFGARAATDPLILHFDRGPIGHLFVFCPSAGLAEYERDRFEKTETVSSGLCALQMDEHGITVLPEGGDESYDLMADFVKWILRTFAPCRVFDDDTGEEITEQVSADPFFLFEP